MSKVVDFCIDEDGVVNVEEFNNVKEWENKFEILNEMVFKRMDFRIVEDFDVEKDLECFNYDGGEVEKEKYNKVVNEMREYVKNNENVSIVSFSLEYDISYLILGEEDFGRLLNLYN